MRQVKAGQIDNLWKLLRRLLRDSLLGICNVTIVPWLLYLYKRRLKQLPEATQIIFLSRLDFGTFIYHAYYARCWEALRGKTALVLLTPRMDVAQQLAEVISPNTPRIYVDHPFLSFCRWLFRPGKYQRAVDGKLFDALRLAYPQSLYIFDALPRSEFLPEIDWRLKAQSQEMSSTFTQAYQLTRLAMDNSEKNWRDAFDLHLQMGQARRIFHPEAMLHLNHELGIGREYVVLNISPQTEQTDPAHSRRVIDPKKYEVIIDELIRQGLDVVIQGREEQPLFCPRKGLIDYARSSCISVKHDLVLYSHCYFAITNKTGPEILCTVCNTPQLGLDYTELSQIMHNIKFRFWPKHYYSNRLSRSLTWKEILQAPSFFDLGILRHDPDITYKDMSPEELLAALNEFIPLVSESDDVWLARTPEQQAFRDALRPIHLDLYDYPIVPCQSYLTST